VTLFESRATLLEGLGYTIEVEHRLIRRGEKRYVLKYKLVEKFHPFFSNAERKSVSSGWQELAVFRSSIIGRRALETLAGSWTLEDYVRAVERPRQAQREFEREFKKLDME
jgi:hypothetical protein